MARQAHGVEVVGAEGGNAAKDKGLVPEPGEGLADAWVRGVALLGHGHAGGLRHQNRHVTPVLRADRERADGGRGDAAGLEDGVGEN